MVGLPPETITDLGLAQSLAKSNMSDGKSKRDYCVFELLCKELLKYYRAIYARTPNYKVIDEIEGKRIKIPLPKPCRK